VIRHPDPKVQAEIEGALRSENPGAQTTWEFWAGNLDLRNRAESLSYGREGTEGAGSLAVGLEAEISGPLDPRIRGREVTVDIVVAGHPTRRFTGRVHRPQNAGFRSTLRANTAGWWANGGGEEGSAVKVGRERRFSGYTPKRAAEEMLYKLPYVGTVEVEDTVQEEFLRGAAEPFEKTEPVGAVLDAISEETEMVFADTRLNGVRGRAPRPAALASDPVWTFRVGRDCNPEAFTHDAETREWHSVQAVRQREGGGVEDLTELVEIPGSEAPEDATYFIFVETEGPEAYEEGARKVTDAVTNLANGQTTGTLTLPFVHSLLEEWDVVEVLEPVEEGGVTILRRWLCRLDLVPDNPFDLTQDISWTGTYSEERLPEAPPPLPAGSGTVVPLPYVGV
jgi:hypothetical protein